MRSLAAIGEMNKERSYPMCFGQCECESGSACVAGLAHADETVSILHLKGDQNRRRGRIGSKRTAQTARSHRGTACQPTSIMRRQSHQISPRQGTTSIKLRTYAAASRSVAWMTERMSLLYVIQCANSELVQNCSHFARRAMLIVRSACHGLLLSLFSPPFFKPFPSTPR